MGSNEYGIVFAWHFDYQYIGWPFSFSWAIAYREVIA